VSNAISAQKFIFAKRFNGLPEHDNFSLEEEELPELKTGGYQLDNCFMYVLLVLILDGFTDILCEALYLSVDPYMRPYSLGWPLGNNDSILHLSSIFLHKTFINVTEYFC